MKEITQRRKEQIKKIVKTSTKSMEDIVNDLMEKCGRCGELAGRYERKPGYSEVIFTCPSCGPLSYTLDSKTGDLILWPTGE